MRKRLYWSRFVLAVVAVAVLAVPAMAQSGASVTAFSVETSRTINAIGAATAANIPAEVLAAVSGGALQLRERLIYNAQLNTITSTWFTVAPGSPNVTPLSANIATSTVGSLTMRIDDVYRTTTPLPSLLFVGVVTDSSSVPYGNLTGLPAAISVGWTAGDLTAINNVVTVVAGRVVAFSQAGAGTITFPAGSGGGTTTPPEGLQVTITPASGSVAVTDQIRLNAAVAGGPSGATYTYAWRAIGKSAAIIRANTATPEVQMQEGQGDYVFEVTVTPSTGTAVTARVTIRYVGL